jgi:signal transduction histidine kinase
MKNTIAADELSLRKFSPNALAMPAEFSLAKLFEYAEGLPEWSKMAGCLLLSLSLGVADYFTGDVSLTMFYVLPIAFASWFIGKRSGLFISMVCSVELFTIDMLVTPPNVTLASVRSWNVFMEVCFLLLTGYLLAKIRAENERTREKSLEVAAANQELEAFNYSVAHDLRSPLLWIGGYSRSILKHCGDRLEAQYRANLQEIIAGVTRMERHIEALLNFSRVTREDLHREPVDLAELVRIIVAELKRTAPARHVTFRIADEVAVNGDRYLLRAVLQNLIGNAWKYTGDQQEAVIEFGVVNQTGSPVYFIRDNGPGFEQAAADKIFIPFQRLPGTVEFEGFGIGLATVQRIILRHGGAIWAEARPGAGATFYFTVESGII